MKKLTTLFLFVSLISACQKVSVNIKNVIFGLVLSTHSIPADGSSTVTVMVQLPTDADVSRRNILFTASPGSWKGGMDSTITVKAVFVNNQLIAQAIFDASTTPGKIIIKAQPALADSANNNFILKDSITAMKSRPATIQLNPSMFGINSDYQSEVAFTGILKNTVGKYVSSGVTVAFSDYLSSGVAAGGSYRNSMLKTKDSSKVSTIYSVGLYPVGTVIYVKATVLDSLGNKTSIKDSIKLTVNK